MGMTIKQVMAKTPLNRREWAKAVKLLEIKTRQNPDGYPMVLAKTLSTQTNKGLPKKKFNTNKYVTTVEVLPKKQVIVSCSCDDFLFTWEMALANKGAARHEYSNGAQPKDRNPLKIPGCCKHIYALGQLLVDKGKL
jgi:hypothetical protein